MAGLDQHGLRPRRRHVEPSISVMKFGSALSFASIVRQSYSLAQ